MNSRSTSVDPPAFIGMFLVLIGTVIVGSRTHPTQIVASGDVDFTQKHGGWPGAYAVACNWSPFEPSFSSSPAFSALRPPSAARSVPSSQPCLIRDQG